MRRRAWLAGGVAVAAATAGVGLAIWRLRGEATQAETALWQMSFERPDGGSLAMASLRGRPVILNFWATWCAPCVREMPLLDRFQREQRAAGWRVVGLAIDGAAPVREYLVRLPMSFAIGLAGSGGVELTRSLGNASSALPFTVVFDREGRAFDRKRGGVQPDDLARWSRQLG